MIGDVCCPPHPASHRKSGVAKEYERCEKEKKKERKREGKKGRKKDRKLDINWQRKKERKKDRNKWTKKDRKLEIKGQVKKISIELFWKKDQRKDAYFEERSLELWEWVLST